MTSNHLPRSVEYAPLLKTQLGAMFPGPEMGQGFGLGFCVRTAPGLNPLPGSVGDYSWAGVYGTYFWVDPKEELVGVIMLQTKAKRVHYRYVMRNLVYQAIID